MSLAKYVLATRESYFILGKDIYDYLHEIHVKAVSLGTAKELREFEKEDGIAAMD